MADRTSIAWTDATWNPITGCTKLSPASPGCAHCYAATFTERFRGVAGHYFENGFDVQLRRGKLDQPLRWRRPRMIFVNSLSDVFHADVPDTYIAQIFAVMALTPRHTFQLLTKRHARMRALLGSRDLGAGLDFETMVRNAAYSMRLDAGRGDCPRVDDIPWPLPNVWLGVSAENAHWAKLRGDALRDVPAAVRFFSCEPLLSPIDTADLAGIDWVIAGGESGPGARVMRPEWARSLRDQCAAASVPFLFKQAGTALAKEWGCSGKGEDPAQWPEHFPREYPNTHSPNAIPDSGHLAAR